MKQTVVGALLIAGLAGAAACSPAEPDVNAPADIAAVNALRNSFVTAFNSGDAAGIGNIYVADGTSAGNHEPSVTGRDAIVAREKANFERMAGKIELTADETKTQGSMGFDRGHFTITLTPKAGGPTITDQGRYVVLLAKGTDGAWKVTSDIDNSSLPLPAPPPPAPPPGKKK